MRGMADRSMPANQKRHVFTYQTRVCVTPEQDKMLRGYGVRFGRVERTLYGDLQKSEAAKPLKGEYLVRLAITGQTGAPCPPAAGTSRQPADENGQSKEDRGPAKKTPAGLEPAASEAEAL